MALAKPEIPAGVYLGRDTKLIWTADDNGEDINWIQATKYAKRLRLGGYSDWRLATIDELEKLYDPASAEKYKIRKPFRLTGWWVWSSSKEGSDSGRSFDFGSGLRTYTSLAGSGSLRALCVRRSRERDE